MNNNYKFISGDTLNDNQIDILTELLFETGYYREIALNNKLSLSPFDFHKNNTILPALSKIRVLIDNKNNIAGFHLSLTKSETLELYANQQNIYDNNADNTYLMRVLDKIYLTNSLSEDLICHNTCIKKDMRGKGLFRLLLADMMDIAKNKNCMRLLSCTWESKFDSMTLFISCGAKVIDTFDFSKTRMYRDRLMVMAVATERIQRFKEYRA